MVNVPAYQLRAAELVAARDAQIPEALRLDPSQIPHNPSKLYRKVLSPREVDIVELDVTGLAGAIAKKQYTASEVTEAYLKSAAAAHSATNCLAWFDVDAARERAKWLDDEMEKNGVVGLLHGVPMSVKGSLQGGIAAGRVSDDRFHVRQGLPSELGTSVQRRPCAKGRRGHDCDIPSRRCGYVAIRQPCMATP
jgi:hypothetical protein